MFATVKGKLEGYFGVLMLSMNCGQVERAIEVYEMMGQRGIPGSIEVYTEAVHACSKNGDLDTAFRIYEDLKKSSIPPDEVNLVQGAYISS